MHSYHTHDHPVLLQISDSLLVYARRFFTAEAAFASQAAPAFTFGSQVNQTGTDVLLRRIAHACEQCGGDPRAAFRRFDANGDGLVSPHEFRHALSQMGIPLQDEELAVLIARVDINSDGMLSYEEFLTQLFVAARDPSIARVGQLFVDHYAAQDVAASSLWSRVSKAFQDRGVPLRQVFALFDADGDGVVSRQELSEAFRLMRLGLDDGDVERMLRDIDLNEDGKVNIHEFVNRLQQ